MICDGLECLALLVCEIKNIQAVAFVLHFRLLLCKASSALSTFSASSVFYRLLHGVFLPSVLLYSYTQLGGIFTAKNKKISAYGKFDKEKIDLPAKIQFLFLPPRFQHRPSNFDILGLSKGNNNSLPSGRRRNSNETQKCLSSYL